MSTLVHIVPSLKMGGLEMLLHPLLRLQTPDWNVHVICLDEVGQLADAAGLRRSRSTKYAGWHFGPGKAGADRRGS